MQILHPFRGSIQQYRHEISDPDRYRPDRCPQCQAGCPLRAHGFYCRTLVDVAFDGLIRVRRYLCRLCKRTVSLLPEFVLPYLRFSVTIIRWFWFLACSRSAVYENQRARLLNPACLISAASSGFAVFKSKPQVWARRWPA